MAPAWVGDMVMAHCLVSTLLASAPDAYVYMLAPPATAPLARRMPGVAGVDELRVGHGELKLAERWRAARRLRVRGFHRAIVLPNTFKSALVPWLARIGIRTGWHGEARFGVLNDRRRLQKDRHPLMIERFMALAVPPEVSVQRPYPLPRLEVDRDNQAQVLARLGLTTEGGVTALCPGAEYGPAKQWPAGHYGAVASAERATGRQVWLLGSPADRLVCDAVEAKAPGVCNLAGLTSLPDVVDLLGAAQRVVCNDSGLMHVACAVGARVIAVYGSTSPAFTPPLAESATVVRLGLDCSPCFQRICPLGHLGCLNDLLPERVIDVLQATGTAG